MAQNDLIVKIIAETDNATKQINKLNKEVSKLTTETKKSNIPLNKQKKSFDDLGKSSKKLSLSLTSITLGLGAMGVAMKSLEFTKMAADAEQAADAFEKIFEDMGLNAEEEFDRIREASKGLIPEASLRQSAVTAASLGVPIEKLGQLMDVAVAKAREMGTDTKAAFNDLATGIGRGSPMILDNLGLTIKLGEANKKMADSLHKSVDELTKQEKQMALTNAVIESGADSVKRFADEGLSSKQKMQKFNASLDDLKVKIGSQLLDPLTKLTETFTEFIDTIDDDAIINFGNDINILISAIKSLYDAGKLLSDVFAPDVLFGDGATILSLFTDGLKVAEIGLTRIVARVDNLTGAMDSLNQQKDSVSGLATAVSKFAGESVEEYAHLDDAIMDVFNANEKQIQQWQSKSPLVYKEKIKELGDENTKLLDIYKKLIDKKPYKAATEGADKAADSVDELSKSIKKYSDTEIKELAKVNKARLKDTEKTLKTLGKSEEKLANDIVKINQKLVSDLAKLSNDRFNMNQDIQTKIADLERGAMSDSAAYYDRQKDADKALSDARLALRAGEYEKYKTYLDQYEALVTDSAGQEIKSGNQVAISKEATRKAAIDGLKTIQSLENEYYDKKKADAQAAHDTAVQQKEVELSSIEAQLVAQKALLVVVKELAEALTGKTIDIDTSMIDAAIAKVNEAKNSIATLAVTPTKIKVDTTEVETTKQKIEEVKTLTLNGITLEVNADTTAADFDIKKLVTNTDGDEISMDVNPEYQKAEKELDNFRKSESTTDVKIPIAVDTSPAKKKLDILVTDMEKPTTSEHTVDDNVPDVLRDINKLKVTTYSDHIIRQKIVPAHADGGFITPIHRAMGGEIEPLRLANGGYASFKRMTGKIPGHDTTGRDDVPIMGTRGEYMQPVKAVDYYGVSGMDAIRRMVIPKDVISAYSSVGSNTGSFRMPKGTNHLAAGGSVGGAYNNVSGDLAPINLTIGTRSFGLMGDREVAEALTRYIKTEGGL